VSAQVLVVDADPESRALLGRVLSEGGFSVETAEGPSDARVRSAERPPELVLLDLELPGDSAWPLLGELRSGERAPLVVGIGGRAALETFLRGVHGGVAGFVGRPVHLGDLLRTCGRVIDSARDAEAAGAERRTAERRALQVSLHVLSEAGKPVAVAELVDLSAAAGALRDPFPGAALPGAPADRQGPDPDRGGAMAHPDGFGVGPRHRVRRPHGRSPGASRGARLRREGRGVLRGVQPR